METFITIYTKWFLNWGQTENAMIFILTGVTASLRSVFIDWLILSMKTNLSYIVVTILASKRILEDRQILLTGISSLLVTVIFIAVALSLSYFGQPTLPYIVCFAIFFFCAS